MLTQDLEQLGTEASKRTAEERAAGDGGVEAECRGKMVHAKFWCQRIGKGGKMHAVDDDEHNIHITRASVANADKLKEGARSTLLCCLNTDGEEVWTAVARFCVGREESTYVMLVVPLGDSLKLKVTGDAEVDLSGYTGIADDVLPDGMSVNSDQESEADAADREEESEEEVEEEEESEEEDEAPAKAKSASKRPAEKPARQEEIPTKKAKGADGKAASGPGAAAAQMPAKTPTNTPAKSEAVAPDFIPSPKYTGSKPGMVFKKDRKGLGYYKDVPPVVSPGGARVPGQPKPKPASADEWASKKVEAMAWKTIGGGLKYRDTVQGNGTAIRKGMTVQMHYTGKLTKNGRQFDSSVGRKPLSYRHGVGEVIKGWDLGLEGMREGGRRTLQIPSALGYGKRGAGRDIPPNSDLTFEVQLVRCK